MSTCYLCGASDIHLFECPRRQQAEDIFKASAKLIDYVQPAIKIATLPTPVKLPVVFSAGSLGTWRIAKVFTGTAIPEWATHGWFLDDQGTIGKRVSELELAEAWELECKASGELNIWELRIRGLVPGGIYTHSLLPELAVFCKVESS